MQDRPPADQVVALAERVLRHVEPADLEVRLREPVEEAGVDVAGDDAPLAARPCRPATARRCRCRRRPPGSASPAPPRAARAGRTSAGRASATSASAARPPAGCCAATRIRPSTPPAPGGHDRSAGQDCRQAAGTTAPVRLTSGVAARSARDWATGGRALADIVDVAVVGARAAGIAAARRLREASGDRRCWSRRCRGSAAAPGPRWSRGCRSISAAAGCIRPSATRSPRWRRPRASRRPPRRLPGASNCTASGLRPSVRQQAWEAYEAFGARLRYDPPASDRAGDAMAPGDRWRPFVDALSGFMNGTATDRLSVRDFLAYDDAASDTNWRLPGGLRPLHRRPRRRPAGGARHPRRRRLRGAALSGSTPTEGRSRRGRRSSRSRPPSSPAARSASMRASTRTSRPPRGCRSGSPTRSSSRSPSPRRCRPRATSLGRFD